MLKPWRRRRLGRSLLAAVLAIGELDRLADRGAVAHADRDEATIAVRPTGVLARLADTGGSAPATVTGAGLVAGAAWGVRNWLDVGFELGAIALGEARHASATLPIINIAYTGELHRTTRVAHAQLGVTLRFGAVWVRSIHVAAGIGGRLRSAATLHVPISGGVASFDPDGQRPRATLDVVATGRLGLARRVGARWTIGAAVGLAEHVGIGAPDLSMFDATVSVAYSWYPVW